MFCFSIYNGGYAWKWAQRVLLASVKLIAMPIISIQMYNGRNQRENDRLAEAITENVVKILKVER